MPEPIKLNIGGQELIFQISQDEVVFQRRKDLTHKLMIDEKVVSKTLKPRVCGNCGKLIEPGSKATCLSFAIHHETGIVYPDWQQYPLDYKYRTYVYLHPDCVVDFLSEMDFY